MTKVLITESILQDTADAIREKGGTSAPMKPSEFAKNIENLPSPAGGVEEKDVDFIDYDGKLLYSYTKDEFLALNEMPENPTHEGLTAQGWNWTLADAKEYITDYGMLVIGQTYITDDEKTRIYIRLDNGHKTPTLGMAINGTVIIDWGDNTVSTATGNSSTIRIDTTHQYQNEGNYIITISPNIGSSYYFIGTQAGTTYILYEYSSANPNDSSFYLNSIYKIELGSNVGINNYGLKLLANLETVTIPNDILNMNDSIGTPFLMQCYNLKSLVFPSTYNSYITIDECGSLENISLGKNNIFGGARSSRYIKKIMIPANGSRTYMENDSALKKMIIPEGIMTITGGSFKYCYSLKELKIPASVTTINSQAFQYCTGLEILDFSNHTAIPSVANSNVWAGMTNCKIIVPDVLYDDWIIATNWTQTAFRIIKASEA